MHGESYIIINILYKNVVAYTFIYNYVRSFKKKLKKNQPNLTIGTILIPLNKSSISEIIVLLVHSYNFQRKIL